MRGAQNAESETQQFFEIGGAGLAPGFADGGFGGAFIVTEVDEGGFNVALDAGGRCGGRFLGFNGNGFEFIPQFEDHALGGLAANTRDFREARKISTADGRDKFLDVHAREDFKGEGRTDARSAEEKLEEMLFALRKEAVEGERVFADVSMDEQGDFGVEFAESGKGGKWNGDEVADASDIEDDLIGTFFEEAAAEESDHRLPVLLVRLGGVNETRDGGWRRAARRVYSRSSR